MFHKFIGPEQWNYPCVSRERHALVVNKVVGKERRNDLMKSIARKEPETFASTLFVRILRKPFWRSSVGSGKSPNRSMIAEASAKLVQCSLEAPGHCRVCTGTDDAGSSRPLRKDNSCGESFWYYQMIFPASVFGCSELYKLLQFKRNPHILFCPVNQAWLVVELYERSRHFIVCS